MKEKIKSKTKKQEIPRERKTTKLNEVRMLLVNEFCMLKEREIGAKEQPEQPEQLSSFSRFSHMRRERTSAKVACRLARRTTTRITDHGPTTDYRLPTTDYKEPPAAPLR